STGDSTAGKKSCTSSTVGTGGPAAGSKSGTSSTVGTGGSAAGTRSGTSSTLGTGGSSAGTTGLDRADQAAGKHGAQGRRNAREHQMMRNERRGDRDRDRD